MRIVGTLLPLLLLGCSSSANGGAPQGDAGAGGQGGAVGAPLGASQQGIATFYGATGAGACGFDATPDDLDVAAMNAPQYSGSAACGECVSVQGPKGSVTVRIVDLCPECATGHLDLSEQAFTKVADRSAGRVSITWTVVACAVQSNLRYHFKDGTSQWWTAIQVRNARIPITKVEWKKAGVWQDIPRTNYNYFVVASGVGPSPFDVRVTAATGATIEDRLPAPSSDVDVAGSSQF